MSIKIFTFLGIQIGTSHEFRPKERNKSCKENDYL